VEAGGTNFADVIGGDTLNFHGNEIVYVEVVEADGLHFVDVGSLCASLRLCRGFLHGKGIGFNDHVGFRSLRWFWRRRSGFELLANRGEDGAFKFCSSRGTCEAPQQGSGDDSGAEADEAGTEARGARFRSVAQTENARNARGERSTVGGDAECG